MADDSAGNGEFSFFPFVVDRIAHVLKRLPSRELADGSPSKEVNEATWYEPPENYALRMIIMMVVGMKILLMLQFCCGTKLLDAFRIRPEHKNKFFGWIIILNLALIPLCKIRRLGFQELAFMLMPCHFVNLSCGLWCFMPCDFFLYIVLGARINSFIAIVEPEYADDFMLEVYTYFWQHLLLVLFPCFVYVWATPPVPIPVSNVPFWTLFIITLGGLFYICCAVPLSLILDRNITYMMSPPPIWDKFVSPEQMGGLSFVWALFICMYLSHFFSYIFAVVESRAFYLFRRTPPTGKSKKKQ